MIYFGTVL